MDTVSPGGDAEATWGKAFDRAAGELSKWSTKYLTTGGRVTIINSYVLPIFLFQAQVYPSDDLLWRRVEKLVENFVYGNHADTERHFGLWSGDLIYTTREQGGLGVLDPRGRVDGVALRCAGLVLKQECSLRRGLSERAAGLPLGWATLYAHKAVLKGGLIKSRRWARLCKIVLKSTMVEVPEVASRWEAEGEFLCYNKSIIHHGNAPFGGQKGTEKLRTWRMSDMVLRKWDGTRTIKPEVLLVRELGGKKEAEMALKAFNAAPERWRQWVLTPMTAEEVAAESSLVSTRLPGGQRCLWEICNKLGRKVELRGLSGKGERMAWDVKIVLCCDSVVPTKLSNKRAIREAGDPRVRLLNSKLFRDEEVASVRELKEPSKGAEAVEVKRQDWEARAGKKVDWERSRKIRDSLVVPARARDVLLRVHNLNLQVGERVPFVKSGVACPNCGQVETLEHCLLECRSVTPVVRAVKSALNMMQPTRQVDRLADLVFGEEGTKSGFPEATMVAVAMHQVWLGSCSPTTAISRGVEWGDEQEEDGGTCHTSCFPSASLPLCLSHPLSTPLPLTPSVSPSASHTLSPTLPLTPSVSPSASHTLCLPLCLSHPLSTPLPLTPSVYPSASHTLCLPLCLSHPLSPILPLTPSVSPSASHTLCLPLCLSHPLSPPLPLTPSVSPSASHTLCLPLCLSHPLSTPLPLTPSVYPSASHTLCLRLCLSHPLSPPLPLTPSVSPSASHTLCLPLCLSQPLSLTHSASLPLCLSPPIRALRLLPFLLLTICPLSPLEFIAAPPCNNSPVAPTCAQ
ncbi:unnamed protein product [Closterium sp. NIES-65]|nr:unnamed protein product [Closterium sp. NIES-65]